MKWLEFLDKQKNRTHTHKKKKPEQGGKKSKTFLQGLSQ